MAEFEYKVVETSQVTDEELEGIRFAMHESSRRPTMAFLFFTRTPR